MKTFLSWTCLALLSLTSAVALSQVSTGRPPYGSFGGGPFDIINLGNLNVRFAIPVLHKAGRGMAFSYDIGYDSSIWTPVTSSGVTQWQPASDWGWQGLTQAATGYISYNKVFNNDHCLTTFYYYTYHDPLGVPHPIGPAVVDGPVKGCASYWPQVYSAGDGSGYTLTLTTGALTGYLTSRSGAVINAPIGTTSGAGTKTDANGNQITVNSSLQFFDTLSSTTQVLAITGTGTPASPTTLTYTAPSTGNAVYKMNYTQYTVSTKFGFSSPAIKEYGPLSNALVSSITLPDQSSYVFTYEKTPGACTPLSGTTECVTGRILTVTLPSGGIITYGYTGTHSGIYSDGSTAGLTRTLNPGGVWTYARALLNGTSGPGSTWTTTISDATLPTANQTVINFAEDSTINGTNTSATYNMYETQRLVYQGSVPSGNVLATYTRCYNANYTTCNSATVKSPITLLDSYSELPNGSQRLSEIAYNPQGLVTDDREYDYGVTIGAAPGNMKLVRETAISYTSLGNGIGDKPRVVTISDWSTGTQTTIASTSFKYDEAGTLTSTPVCPAAGCTPQHVSITGARGNLTTLTTSTSSTATLSKTFTNYDTGNLNVATDVNGAQTTYVYSAAANPYNSSLTASCGNSFPTSINEPLSLSRSMQWNCIGGIPEQTTDENGQIVKSGYTDPDFWRPANVYDQQNNETTISYIGQNAVESALQNFNGGQSSSDFLTTIDGFGRPTFSQRKQGPTATNYDTGETDYNSLGQPYRSTMPYSTTASPTSDNMSAPATTTTYDALGRVLSATDANGGSVSYTYTNNDVLQTVSGTQSFQKQFEYDGLGRLTSVCEISTTLPNHGACGQGVGQTGYLTSYTYDALGHLLTVSQNAQPNGTVQARSFAYDWLGRMTSESNPEVGNKTYIYDVATATCSSGVSNGDLVETIDNALVHNCFGIDLLHRTFQWFAKTTNGPTGNCRFYVYGDRAYTPPSGVTITNGKTRVVEAYVNSNCAGAPLVDEWFSYSARGETTDMYESTPNSGGYYHSTATYWANGGLETRGLFNSSNASIIPTLTYAVDAEGRTASVTAASGQNPVSSVAYSTGTSTAPDGALTSIVFGSQDSDTFQYDPNTGRMTQYSFNVNNQSAVGNVNWNSNGTLQQLAITDPFNSQDNQTCTYTFDDLARSSGVNCGSLWTQAFNYDAFGNITKTGSSSWIPNYSGVANNQYQTGWNGVQYDANGKLLNDTINTYSWDTLGDMVSVNSAAITYDAFDRMVEAQNVASGPLTQFVYLPTGGITLQR